MKQRFIVEEDDICIVYGNEIERLNVHRVWGLLNEQQATITALEKENKRKENEIKQMRKAINKIPPNIRKVWYK